jgi:hypothetical protein
MKMPVERQERREQAVNGSTRSADSRTTLKESPRRVAAGDGTGSSVAGTRMGEYPMIVLTWEDAMRGAPWEYIEKCEEALTKYENR